MDVKILVVDDEEDICNLVVEFFERFGFQTDKAGGVKAAMAMMESAEYDIIITDKNMPDAEGNKEGGMVLLRHCRESMPGAEVIVMTGYATVETAVEAMKLGAFDYILKPFSVDDLKEKIERIIEYKRFLNSGNTLEIYRTLHTELLNLLENRKNLPEAELRGMLKTLGARIDHVFGSQKEYEKIIDIQRQALENIATYADHLKEGIAGTDPSFGLIEKICDEAKKRV